MQTDLKKDKTAIKKKGGLDWGYMRVDDDGSPLVTDKVQKITVSAGGTGYLTAPTVVFTGGGSSNAAATAIVAEGVVTGIEITNAASGYTSAPAITFTGGSGSNAAATASLSDIWHDGVYRKEHDFKFDAGTEEELENGDKMDSDELNVDLTLKSAQDDADLEMFLLTETLGVNFAIICDRGLSKTGYKKVTFIPIAKISRSYSSKSGDRKPDIKISGKDNYTAVTPATVPSWAGTAADFVVPAMQKVISVPVVFS